MFRGILDNVLSGMKAGFKAILNLEHPIEREKMFIQKGSSKLSATLLALILGASVFMAGPVWAAKYVTDPSTGKVVTGMIVEETAKQVKVIVNPLAKAAPAIVDKASIVARRKLPNSLMPEGLLNRLSQEEVLDLIAYVLSGGDMKSKLFKAHKH